MFATDGSPPPHTPSEGEGEEREKKNGKKSPADRKKKHRSDRSDGERGNCGKKEDSGGDSYGGDCTGSLVAHPAEHHQAQRKGVDHVEEERGNKTEVTRNHIKRERRELKAQKHERTLLGSK